MAYFPVIIRTAHIKEARDYMEKIHNGAKFEDLFRNMTNAPFCQYCIMMNYIWYTRARDSLKDGILARMNYYR